MHRRSLPIADPCNVFRPTPENAFCSKCEKHVHDLSAMTERAAARFLAAHAGQRICVAYRTAKDGTILVRPEPRPLGVLLVALGLAACTGYAPDIQHPDERCRDEQGYEIDCREPSRDDVLVMPQDDAPATTSRDVREPTPTSADDPSLMVGQIVLPAAPDPNAPLPAPEPVPIVDDFGLHDDGEVLVGRIDIDESLERSFSRETRRAERADRREARREARRERRAAR